VLLFQLERDSGKTLKLEDLEGNSFSIDEKSGQESAFTHLTHGSAAHSHKRGNGTGNTNTNGTQQHQCQ
jgi:hypothetical protein